MSYRDDNVTALLPAGARRIALYVLTCCAIFVAAVGEIVLRLPAVRRLDVATDSAVQRAFSQHQLALHLVAGLGQKVGVGALTLILVVLCVAFRRFNGALLAAISIPMAPAVTEYVLKALFSHADPYRSFPSGHTTAAFAMATVMGVLVATPGKRVTAALRLATALAALLAGAAVIVAVIGLGMHKLTGALGGAAVGVGVALAVALLLDLPLAQRLIARGAQLIEMPRAVRGRP